MPIGRRAVSLVQDKLTGRNDVGGTVLCLFVVLAFVRAY